MLIKKLINFISFLICSLFLNNFCTKSVNITFSFTAFKKVTCSFMLSNKIDNFIVFLLRLTFKKHLYKIYKFLSFFI